MEKKASVLTRPLVVVLLACFCNMLWGSAIPFINLGYRLFAIPAGEPQTQILFAGCRFFLSGVLTVAFASIASRKLVHPKKENADKVVKLGLVQTAFQYLFFFIGVANTPSVKGAIIQGLNAFTAIVVACFVFRSEKMTVRKWLGGLLGVVGIVVVNLNGGAIDASFKLTGEVFLMISMVAGAYSNGLIKRYSQVDNPVALSGWQFMFGGLVMAVCGFAAGGRLNPQGFGAVAVLLYLALLSAVAYTLWAVLLKVNPVSRVAVFTFLQPIFGVILSLILYGGENVPLMRCGIALVLVCASIVIVNKEKSR